MMKKKNLTSLKLRKSKISNLNVLHKKFGGYATEETEITTSTQSETNPNNTVQTLYCGETETCYSKCDDCNTNDTTRGQQSPSLQVACNALGSIIGC